MTDRVKHVFVMSDRVLADRVLSGRVKCNGGLLLIGSDIIRGHLDSIILKLISEKDRYGYEIFSEIENRTNSKFKIKEATLYAVLQRLVKKKMLKSYLGDVSKGGRRKYYTITEQGKIALKIEMKNWQNARAIINIFMEDNNE